MRKALKEYGLQVLVTFGVSGAVTVYALIQKYWNVPTAIVYGLLLLAVAGHLADRLGIGPSLKSRVREWLDESGFSVTTIQREHGFQFLLRDEIGIVTSITQFEANGPISIAVAGLRPTPDRLAVFRTWSHERQTWFWHNVRLELLRYGLEYTNLTLEEPGVMLSTQVIPGRSMTGIEFRRQVLFVRSGARLYYETLIELDRDALRQETPASTASGAVGSTGNVDAAATTPPAAKTSLPTA